MKLFKIIIIICLIIISSITNAQDKKIFDNVGIYYNPAMDFNNTDIFHYIYSVGIRSNFRLNDKFAIKLGLGYEHIEYTRAHYGVPWPIGIGFNISHLELQIIKTDFHLRFDFLNPEKKIAIYLFSGPTINTNIREKAHLYYYKDYSKYYDNKNVFIHSGIISAGAGFSTIIKDKITISIEPSYSTVLWRNEKTILGQCINRFGISLGIEYNL